MDEKKKEGVSVREIEGYAKKHRFEIFFSLVFIIATFLSLVYFGTIVSIFFAGAGGILGTFFPKTIELWTLKSYEFIHKQQIVIQMIIGAAILVISIFLPFIIFFVMGLHGGRGLAQHSGGMHT